MGFGYKRFGGAIKKEELPRASSSFFSSVGIQKGDSSLRLVLYSLGGEVGANDIKRVQWMKQ